MKKRKRGSKTPCKTASTAVATRPGKNGGTLLAGGMIGNKGGTGRPPNIVREMAAEGLVDALPDICKMASGELLHEEVRVRGKDGEWVPTERMRTAEFRDRLKAGEFLGKVAGVLAPVSGMKADAAAGLPDGTVIRLSLGEMTPGDLED